MKDLKEAFGQNLRKIRQDKKLTQESLSELLNLSQRQLVRIESGENFPSAETLAKISLILQVDLKSLFDFEWNEDTMYLATGVYNKPSLKLIRQNNSIIVKTSNQIFLQNIQQPISSENQNQIILELAKNTGESITVEYFNGKKRTGIKTFHSSGQIDDVLTEQALIQSENYLDLKNQIAIIAQNQKKLEFLRLAVQALNSKPALSKLKNVIEGMELLQ